MVCTVCLRATTYPVQVLRFHACWDDSRRPFGDKMPFVIHYYLADHTMEVREVRLRNDGRDPFPLLVRRMPIPKKVSICCFPAALTLPRSVMTVLLCVIYAMRTLRVHRCPNHVLV